MCYSESKLKIFPYVTLWLNCNAYSLLASPCRDVPRAAYDPTVGKQYNIDFSISQENDFRFARPLRRFHCGSGARARSALTESKGIPKRARVRFNLLAG